MEGRHLAVLGAIGIWCLAYLVSIYHVGYFFTDGKLVKNAGKQINSRKILITSLITLLVVVFIPGLFYRLGGALEKGNGIAWGCYIEDFGLGTMLLLFLSLMILTLVLVIGLIKPSCIKFKSRIKILLAYITLNILSLIWFILAGVSIWLFSGPLSGLGSSCL